jgi:gliding motility-associated lipoprotein GldH
MADQIETIMCQDNKWWVASGGLRVLVTFIAVLGLFSCDRARVYEENHELASKSWYEDSVQTFSFAVNDVSKPYNVLINIRNSESYPYYNLFLRYYLSDSLGKELKSQQLELLLMDAKTGKPEGKGLGDIFSHQFNLLKGFVFPKAGTYTVKLKQYMRQDPLPDIYSVGVRVEDGTIQK